MRFTTKPSTETPLRVTLADDEGDVLVQINGIDVAYFDCEDGTFTVLYVSDQADRECLAGAGVQFDEGNDGLLRVT